MKLENLLVRTIQGQAVHLECMDRTCMDVIGSSLPISAVDRCKAFQGFGDLGPYSFTIDASQLEDGRRGVIALAFYQKGIGQQNPYMAAHLIEIRKKGEEPIVGLEHTFIPDPDRMGEVVRLFINVRIGDAVYTTNPKPAPGQRYVADPDLLCRYLVGQVDDEAITEAAEVAVEEASAREQLSAIRRVLQEDMGGNDTGDDLADCVKARIACRQRRIAELVQEVGELADTITTLREKNRRIASTLGDAVSIPWWDRGLRCRIKAILAEIAKVVPDSPDDQ